MDAVERQRLMDEGARAFNERRFYEAHELWETLWNAIEGAERLWIQGLIQLATALYKLERDRPDLCLSLLEKGAGKLAGAPLTVGGWDARRLRDDALQFARALAAGERPALGALFLHAR